MTATSLCTVDWTAAGAWAQAAAGLLGAGAVVTAALIGRSSFDSWLRQRQVERRLEVGERILTVANRAKDAFVSIRSPGMFVFEANKADERIAAEKIAHSPGQSQSLRWSVTIATRLADQKVVWDELFECATLARIFFGADMEGLVREFWVQRNRVRVSALMYWERHDEAFKRRCEFDIWEGAGDIPDGPGDAVGTAVAVAFNTIEAALIPLLRDVSESVAGYGRDR